MSEIVIQKRNGNHTWLLTEELVPIVLCSDLISKETKKQLAQRICEFPKETDLSDLLFGKPKLPVIQPETKLIDLMGKNFHTIFLMRNTKGFLN